MPEPEPSAPVADRRPTVRVHHGDEFADPYEWLRDKEDADVLGYLKAENEYTEAVTAANQPLVDAVFSEIKARTQETDLSVPSYATHRGRERRTGTTRARSRARSTRSTAAPPPRTAALPPALEGAIEGEEVLLDANAEAEGHEFFALGRVQHLHRRAAARLLRRRHGRRAVHPAGQGPADRRAARGPDSRHRVRGGLGRQRPPLLHPGRPGLAAVRRAAAPAGHRPGHRRRGLHRARRAVLARGGRPAGTRSG